MVMIKEVNLEEIEAIEVRMKHGVILVADRQYLIETANRCIELANQLDRLKEERRYYMYDIVTGVVLVIGSVISTILILMHYHRH